MRLSVVKSIVLCPSLYCFLVQYTYQQSLGYLIISCRGPITAQLKPILLQRCYQTFISNHTPLTQDLQPQAHISWRRKRGRIDNSVNPHFLVFVPVLSVERKFNYFYCLPNLEESGLDYQKLREEILCYFKGIG